MKAFYNPLAGFLKHRGLTKRPELTISKNVTPEKFSLVLSQISLNLSQIFFFFVWEIK